MKPIYLASEIDMIQLWEYESEEKSKHIASRHSAVIPLGI